MGSGWVQTVRTSTSSGVNSSHGSPEKLRRSFRPRNLWRTSGPSEAAGDLIPRARADAVDELSARTSLVVGAQTGNNQVGCDQFDRIQLDRLRSNWCAQRANSVGGSSAPTSLIANESVECDQTGHIQLDRLRSNWYEQRADSVGVKMEARSLPLSGGSFC
ncbi:hypothetical protein CROQUDRAFT_91594 [Cronartium quercuum f. sp. fusiforme G11]|uniref:Uncharacterized protein n=1 Tax=Cronartium quercuum f. sp. fusiforme G11 TaxID=708437 RepID=A0A9P6NPP1_9BASI|nr:hypothetical protein CROQUDRAFT_91594 [Cronartium quercuum f. sp. fusiforme G11]